MLSKEKSGFPKTKEVSPLNIQEQDKQPLLGKVDQLRKIFDNFFQKMAFLFPFFWPKGNPGLQCRIVICIVLIALGRCLGVLIPLFNKKVIDSMAASTESLQFRWDYILIYMALWFVVQQGVLSNCHAFVWILVEQFTAKAIIYKVYAHLHQLSLGWHLNRKTGEVLRICERGRYNAPRVFYYVLFNIIPAFLDIIIAMIYFTAAFNIWFGLIVLLTVCFYLVITFFVARWRRKFREGMIEKENAFEAKAVDALLNFETVKYYNAEHYEVDAYKRLMDSIHLSEWTSDASYMLFDTLQSCVITLGILSGSLLCASKVATRELTVGDYVLCSSYILQMWGPLTSFGSYCRALVYSLTDLDKLIDILKLEPDIKDIPNALPLEVSGAEVQFHHVRFSYLEEKVILSDISFTVPAGKTVALVGPSGSGKSTIMRLLFRLYDVNSGSILLDGQDITKVQQDSLRQNIGVVPQDTVLFNDSIRYNIRYGRLDATDEEVEEAARAADIHDKILTFPQGYETVVGERGLKLSGGEKQRVAIARTILKNPAMVLLDEATSSLDTHTERNILASLHKMCANRTTLIVAHRLSTVVEADSILVLNDGEIVEKGSHGELLELNGLYASMWQQQQKTQQPESDSNTVT